MATVWDQGREGHVMKMEKLAISATAGPVSYGKEFEFISPLIRRLWRALNKGSHGIQYMFSKGCSGCCVENGGGGAKWNRKTSWEAGG